ncbi:MAG: cobalamin biosynthesis protein CbiX [Proteobacteria bacterium]|nr:cobalamin biosynthesis protein CbiX [Pseudomonadota bacterium]
MSQSATILFAHGARNPEWRKPLEAIRDAMIAAEPGRRVEIAYLEFLTPPLPEAIDTVAGEGYRELTIVPIFMAQSGHTKRDLPALLAAAWERHPQLDIKLAVPIGEAPVVVRAIARYALQPTLAMGEPISG